jgi:hypothetical protein
MDAFGFGALAQKRMPVSLWQPPAAVLNNYRCT